MKMRHPLMVYPVLTHYRLWLLDLCQRSRELPRVLISSTKDRETMYL